MIVCEECEARCEVCQCDECEHGGDDGTCTGCDDKCDFYPTEECSCAPIED